MPFFKGFRGRSRVSLIPENQPEDNHSNTSEGSNVTDPTSSKSTATLASTNGTSTPASSVQSSQSNISVSKMSSINGSAPAQSLPQRPAPVSGPGSINKRHSSHSMNVRSPQSSTLGLDKTPLTCSQGLIPPGSSPAPRLPPSLYEPKVLSISDNSWVRGRDALLWTMADGQYRCTKECFFFTASVVIPLNDHSMASWLSRTTKMASPRRPGPLVIPTSRCLSTSALDQMRFASSFSQRDSWARTAPPPSIIRRSALIICPSPTRHLYIWQS